MSTSSKSGNHGDADPSLSLNKKSLPPPRVAASFTPQSSPRGSKLDSYQISSDSMTTSLTSYSAQPPVLSHNHPAHHHNHTNPGHYRTKNFTRNSFHEAHPIALLIKRNAHMSSAAGGAISGGSGGYPFHVAAHGSQYNTGSQPDSVQHPPGPGSSHSLSYDPSDDLIAPSPSLPPQVSPQTFHANPHPLSSQHPPGSPLDISQISSTLNDPPSSPFHPLNSSTSTKPALSLALTNTTMLNQSFQPSTHTFSTNFHQFQTMRNAAPNMSPLSSLHSANHFQQAHSSSSRQQHQPHLADEWKKRYMDLLQYVVLTSTNPPTASSSTTDTTQSPPSPPTDLLNILQQLQSELTSTSAQETSQNSTRFDLNITAASLEPSSLSDDNFPADHVDNAKSNKNPAVASPLLNMVDGRFAPADGTIKSLDTTISAFLQEHAKDTTALVITARHTTLSYPFSHSPIATPAQSQPPTHALQPLQLRFDSNSTSPASSPSHQTDLLPNRSLTPGSSHQTPNATSHDMLREDFQPVDDNRTSRPIPSQFLHPHPTANQFGQIDQHAYSNTNSQEQQQEQEQEQENTAKDTPSIGSEITPSSQHSLPILFTPDSVPNLPPLSTRSQKNGGDDVEGRHSTLGALPQFSLNSGHDRLGSSSGSGGGSNFTPGYGFPSSQSSLGQLLGGQTSSSPTPSQPQFTKPSLPSDYFLSVNPQYLPPPPVSYLIPMHSDSPLSRHLLHRNASLLLTQRKSIVAVFAKFKDVLPIFLKLSTAFQNISDIFAQPSDSLSPSNTEEYKGDMVASYLTNPKAIYIFNLMNQHQVVAQQQDQFIQNHQLMQQNFLNGISNINPVSDALPHQQQQHHQQQQQQQQQHHASKHTTPPSFGGTDLSFSIGNSFATLSTASSTVHSTIHSTIHSPNISTPSNPPTGPNTNSLSLQPFSLQQSSSQSNYSLPTSQSSLLSFQQPSKLPPSPPLPSSRLSQPQHQQSSQLQSQLQQQQQQQQLQPQQSNVAGDISTTHDLFLLGNLFTTDTTFQSFSAILSSFAGFFTEFNDHVDSTLLVGIEQELQTECSTLASLYANYIEAMAKYEEHFENITERQEKWVKNNQSHVQMHQQQQHLRHIHNESIKQRKSASSRSSTSGISPQGYVRYSTLGQLPPSSTTSSLSIPQQQQHRGSLVAQTPHGAPSPPPPPSVAGSGAAHRSSLFTRDKKMSTDLETEDLTYSIQDSFEPEVLQYLVSHYHQHQTNEYVKYYGTVNPSQVNTNEPGFEHPAAHSDHSSSSNKSHNQHPSPHPSAQPTSRHPSTNSSTPLSKPNTAATDDNLMEIVGFGSGGVVTVSLRNRPTPFNAANSIQQASNVTNKLPQVVPPSPRSKNVLPDVRLSTPMAQPQSSSVTPRSNLSPSKRKSNFVFDNHSVADSIDALSIASSTGTQHSPVHGGLHSTPSSFGLQNHASFINSQPPTVTSHDHFTPKHQQQSHLQHCVGECGLAHNSFLNFNTHKCPATFQLLLHYQHPCLDFNTDQTSDRHEYVNANDPSFPPPQTQVQKSVQDSSDIYCVDICLFPPHPPTNPSFSPLQQLCLSTQHYHHVRALLILYINYLLVSSRIQTISTLNSFLFKFVHSMTNLETSVMPQVNFLYEYQFRLQELYNAYVNYQESLWLNHTSNLQLLQSQPFAIDSLVPSARQAHGQAFDQEYTRYLIDEVVPIRTTIPTLLEAGKPNPVKDRDDATEASITTDNSFSAEGGLDGHFPASFGSGMFPSDSHAHTHGLERIVSSLSVSYGGNPNSSIPQHQQLVNQQIDVRLSQANINPTEMNRQTVLWMLANPPPYLSTNLFNLPLYKQPSTNLLFTTPRIILCGWLLKQASNLTKDWQRRFFVLTSDTLLYFRDCVCYKTLNSQFSAAHLIEGYRQDVTQLKNIITKKMDHKKSKTPPITAPPVDDGLIQVPAKNSNLTPAELQTILHPPPGKEAKDDTNNRFCQCNVGVKVVDILLSSARLPSSKLIKSKHIDTSFELVSPNRRVYLLRAPSIAERDFWLQMIQKTIGDTLCSVNTRKDSHRDNSIPRSTSRVRGGSVASTDRSAPSPQFTSSLPGGGGIVLVTTPPSPPPHPPPLPHHAAGSATAQIPANLQPHPITAISPPTAYPYICTIANGPAQFQNHNSHRVLGKISSQSPACADCSSPIPDWCSINNGVLICIRCSAIHRSLGVQVSKVRSITLDQLDSVVESLLFQIGNTNFNTIYEGNQMPDLCPRPQLDITPHNEREQYISLKYKTKTFVSKDVLLNFTGVKNEVAVFMFWAIAHSDLISVMKLFAAGADPNVTFDCPINVATARDHEIEHVDISIDVNVVLHDELPPDLFTAGPDGTQTPESNTLLIPKGTTISPIHFACVQGDLTILEFLILNNTNLNVQDSLGRTPLQLCKQAKYEAGIQRLSRR